MKTIKQIFNASLESLSVGAGGKPHPHDIARLRLETIFSFWIPWLTILDPLDRRSDVSFGIKAIFEPGSGRQSVEEITEGVKLMKQRLGVARLGFNTYFKLRHIVREACEKAASRCDVDIALSALMVFVQLELGAIPDAEYGHFPERRRLPFRLDDADLPDDPIAAQIELEGRHDMTNDSGTSEYNLLRWFKWWEENFKDAEKFEKTFPGAGHRRPHVLQALEPIFIHLDPVFDGDVLDMFLDWVKLLLKSPLEESRLAAAERVESPSQAA
jgi:hypothetical protein